jgi:hypothetical protein
MTYAKAGGSLPEELHGIFWMDQRGVNLPLPSDPAYTQVGPNAADELAFSFGDVEWDPERRCTTPLPVYGAGKKGQWLFMDSGNGTNDVFTGVTRKRLMLEFCFTDESHDVADIWMWGKVTNLPLWNVVIPTYVAHLTMERKSWGWDRKSEVPMMWGETMHYPLFQVVDGYGHRTQYYDRYLQFANKAQICPEGDLRSVSCSQNQGHGTSLLAVSSE